MEDHKPEPISSWFVQRAWNCNSGIKSVVWGKALMTLYKGKFGNVFDYFSPGLRAAYQCQDRPGQVLRTAHGATGRR